MQVMTMMPPRKKKKVSLAKFPKTPRVPLSLKKGNLRQSYKELEKVFEAEYPLSETNKKKKAKSMKGLKKIQWTGIK